MTRQLVAMLALVLSLMIGGFAMAEEGAWSVNINTATEQVLVESLDGIGESKAKAIIAYREENGAFTSADELANVKGIGAATVEKNRGNIVLK